MSQITTHILDMTTGQPARGVPVILFQHDTGEQWKEIARGVSNDDGRIPTFLSSEAILPFGFYKIKFETKEYFERQMTRTFYPYVEVAFEIRTINHYHVPLLLSPFGYSTYRGS